MYAVLIKLQATVQIDFLRRDLRLVLRTRNQREIILDKTNNPKFLCQLLECSYLMLRLESGAFFCVHQVNF